MLEHILIAVEAVLPTFLIIALGLLARRRNMVDESALSKFNSVAFRIFLFCQIFLNVYNAEFGEAFDLRLVVFSTVALLITCALSLLTAALTEPRRDRRGVMAQGILRTNFVLLGMPLLTSLFGPSAAGLVSMMLAVTIPLTNIMAVVFLEIYAGGEIDVKKLLRDIAKNPLIDATFAALLVKLIRLPLDRVPVLMSALGSMSSAATPLCLFILGASFKLSGVGSYVKSLWITVVMRLFVIPLLSITAAAAVGIRGASLGVVLILFGAPTAVTSYNLTREIGGDADLAASIVVLGTALSCLTLFVWIVALKTLGLF